MTNNMQTPDFNNMSAEEIQNFIDAQKAALKQLAEVKEQKAKAEREAKEMEKLVVLEDAKGFELNLRAFDSPTLEATGKKSAYLSFKEPFMVDAAKAILKGDKDALIEVLTKALDQLT